MRKLCATVLAVVLVFWVGGCSDSAGARHANSASPSTSGRASGTPKVTASPVAPMLTKLPVFGSEADAEQTVWDIIHMAATYAKNVRAEDRQPDVLAVSTQTVCVPGVVNIGMESQIDACYPGGVNSKVSIIFSPAGVWANVQKREDHGGGQVWTQDHVLAAYMNFLLFREGQRQSLMTANDDASGAKIKQISMCTQGKVIGGLRDHGLLSSAHLKLYQYQMKNADFQKGLRGDC